MYKVLLTDNITPRALEVLGSYENIDPRAVGTLPPEDLSKELAGCHAVIVRSPTSVTAAVLENATLLKFIGRAGAGTDNIDVQVATDLGIVVMNTPHANTISTAEHTIGMLLALARRIPQAHVSVTNHEWNRKTYQGVELYKKTLGVIGLGAVGREVAKRMLAFGMKVVAADPFVEPQIAARLGVELVSKQELLSRSHAITIHVPLDSGTRGLIGAAELNAMREGVLLVNCARGGIVDERALLAALEKDHVSAVGLDVFENEPPGDNPLLEHPRCVFTPHIGAATAEARIRVAMDIAESVAEALTKGIVRNVVNQPERPR